jgi:hypothetical protein
MFSGENKNEVIGAFVKAQPKFGVPKRTKKANVNTRSGGSYSYSYAPLEEIIAATREALTENGLACFNNVVMPAQNVVTVSCVLLHSSGQSHESEPLIFQVDGSPQATGSAITYGRRYSMSALLGIASEEDTDAQDTMPQNAQQGQSQRNGNARGGKQQQAKAVNTIPSEEAEENAANAEQPITQGQLERLQRIVKEAGVKGRSMKLWLNGLGISESAAIKRGQYQNIVLAVQGGKVPEAPAKQAKEQ